MEEGYGSSCGPGLSGGLCLTMDEGCTRLCGFPDSGVPEGLYLDIIESLLGVYGTLEKFPEFTNLFSIWLNQAPLHCRCAQRIL